MAALDWLDGCGQNTGSELIQASKSVKPGIA
jgi:hypothetical protein